MKSRSLGSECHRCIWPLLSSFWLESLIDLEKKMVICRSPQHLKSTLDTVTSPPLKETAPLQTTKRINTVMNVVCLEVVFHLKFHHSYILFRSCRCTVQFSVPHNNTLSIQVVWFVNDSQTMSLFVPFSDSFVIWATEEIVSTCCKATTYQCVLRKWQ